MADGNYYNKERAIFTTQSLDCLTNIMNNFVRWKMGLSQCKRAC